MRITVITIFPEFFDSFRTTSIIKRAIEGHRVDFETVDFRSFTLDKHCLLYTSGLVDDGVQYL